MNPYTKQQGSKSDALVGYQIVLVCLLERTTERWTSLFLISKYEDYERKKTCSLFFLKTAKENTVAKKYITSHHSGIMDSN